MNGWNISFVQKQEEIHNTFRKSSSLINWEQPMLYHTGDSQHIQNTQINKVICENEKKKLQSVKNYILQKIFYAIVLDMQLGIPKGLEWVFHECQGFSFSTF